MTRSEIELEKIGLLPSNVRDFIYERDGWDDTGVACRCCGRWTDMPAIHHIVFRSQGGLDVPKNLITLAQGWGGPGGHDCHLGIAHGPNARSWREIFLQVVERPELTALQWKRWNA